MQGSRQKEDSSQEGTRLGCQMETKKGKHMEGEIQHLPLRRAAKGR